MNKALGDPIAYGRTADIYAWEEGTILKLFHNWFDLEGIKFEAQMARAVHASGLPVPAVGEIVQVNGRNGLIYERMRGVSMWDVLSRKPWTLFRFARQLAALHAEMHNNPIQLDIPAQRQRLTRKINQAKALPADLKAKTLAALHALPDGDRVCHGDFHPDNVLIASQGAVVIDWIDASRGNPLADVARTTVISIGAVESSQIQSKIEKLFVRIFHAVYLRRYFRLCPSGEAEYRRWLPVVAAARLSENIPELEQWLLAQVEKRLD